MKKDIIIIGGGIAGLTTAIALGRIGVKVNIYEAAPKIDAVGAGLGLGGNAIIALQRIGLMEEAIEAGRILPMFKIYDSKGKIITSTDTAKNSSRYGADNFTIHRAKLHRLLLSKIDSGTIHLNKKATAVEHEEQDVVVKFQDGSEVKTDYLIVADGIHSAIRQQLLPASKPRYAGYTCYRAVIDNSELSLTGSSESWGRGARFGIVPLADNKVYWFACLNAERGSEKYRNYNVKDLMDTFKDFHEPIPAILRETKDENLLWNDIMDIKPIENFAFGNILLIGDAAHATTPNMGQGACQAIEDAVVLADEISKNPNVAQAFKGFEARRIKRTHWITNTSWRVGKAAQLENNLLTSLRDFVFRSLPASVNEKQLQKLYNVDF